MDDLCSSNLNGSRKKKKKDTLINLSTSQHSSPQTFLDMCTDKKNTSKHHKEMKDIKMNGEYQVTHLRIVILPTVMKRYSREKNNKL